MPEFGRKHGGLEQFELIDSNRIPDECFGPGEKLR